MTGGSIVYEVVRIINSKPLFAKDHYNRFINTIKNYIDTPDISSDDFLNNIQNTIDDNKIINGNIKIESRLSSDSNKINLRSNQVPHKYPTDEDYFNGVKTCTIHYERKDPQNKIWDERLREKIDSMMKAGGYYEIIYVDKENKITEGSRSNIFFIKNNCLFTAPIEYVLQGITRKYVIETASLCKIDFIEEQISLSNLSFFDSAFISGTSPKILPISYIDDIKFHVSNPKLRKLMTKFDELINLNV